MRSRHGEIDVDGENGSLRIWPVRSAETPYRGSSAANTDGAEILADIGTNLTLNAVAIIENKVVVDGEETVVEGYTCEGIPIGDGNCVAARQGDANRDGKVDIEDFLLLAATFG